MAIIKMSMGATITHQMTVEEFERLPETGAFYYELRHGELVQVTRPIMKHFVMQRHLRRPLEGAIGEAGIAEIEFAFRALPEFEFRIADVAVVTRDRWDLGGHFRGAPDLVIEVLSPSNTMAEILDKEELCLENGSREFWVVDIDRRQIKVSTMDGLTTTYRPGQEIRLQSFSATLSVDAIFAA